MSASTKIPKPVASMADLRMIGGGMKEPSSVAMALFILLGSCGMAVHVVQRRQKTCVVRNKMSNGFFSRIL